VKRFAHAALALVFLLVAVEARAAATPGARGQAELLAQAGEARYRLALLRSRKTDPGPDPDLKSALRALEEACELDPANLSALAYLGLARLESAARGGKPFDREAFDSVRGPLEELFRLSRGWADPRTRALLGEVARSVDASLAGMDDAPADVLGWWQSWRGRVTRTAKSAPPASNVVTLVEDLRTSPLAWVRERAAEKLSESTGKLQPGVVEALAKALREDKSPWVRAAAAKALSTLRPGGWDVRLAEALRNDESVWVRRICARKLVALSGAGRSVKLPARVGSALVDALAQDTPRVASAAAVTLGSFPDTDAPLIRAMQSTSSLVRMSAATGLSRWGKPPERVVELLGDPRPGVRAAATMTFHGFAGFHVWDDEVHARLVGLLEDPDAEVRKWAALAFGGRVQKAARERFLALLKDEDPGVRFCTALVVMSANKDDEAALTAMRSLANSQVLLDATATAGTIGDQAKGILAERERKKGTDE